MEYPCISGDHRASRTAYGWLLPRERIGTTSCAVLRLSCLYAGPILVVSKNSSFEQLVATTDPILPLLPNLTPALHS